MDNNEVVNNVVENQVVPEIVETANEAVQAIQPVVNQLPAVASEKTYLGFTSRQLKDGAVVTGIGVGSVLIFEGVKSLIKHIPGWFESGKNMWNAAKTGSKPQAEQPNQQTTVPPTPEQPAPATTEVPATPQAK